MSTPRRHITFIGYPGTRGAQAGGTRRLDQFGRPIPGEFDGNGRRLKTAADGLEGGRGLTPQDEWSRLFPGVHVAAPVAPQQGPTPSGATVDSAQAGAQPKAPEVGSTRRTAFGGVETLVASQSGPRWVASTNSAPPMTNFRPGDSGDNSLANHAQVARATPAPITGPGGNAASDAANLAQNKAIYSRGGGFPGAPQGGPLQSEGIQRQLDDSSGVDPRAIAAAAGTGNAVKTPFGNISSNSGARPAPAPVAETGIPGIPETQTQTSPQLPDATRAQAGAAPIASPATPQTDTATPAAPSPFGTALGAVATGARAGIGAAAQAAADDMNDLIKKGRTAFGDMITPLKQSRPAQRADVVQTEGWN